MIDGCIENRQYQCKMDKNDECMVGLHEVFLVLYTYKKRV